MATEETTSIKGYDEPFEGHTGAEVEEFLKGKLRAHEKAINDRATLDMRFEPAEDGTKGTLSIRDAIFLPSEKISTKNAANRICASPTVSCPPAVSVVMSGEIITERAIELMLYYGIDKIDVIK